LLPGGFGQSPRFCLRIWVNAYLRYNEYVNETMLKYLSVMEAEGWRKKVAAAEAVLSMA
jgi:hypothetical protein